MTLDLEKYAFTDGRTALSASELNTRFYAIVRRLHALELLSIDWEAAVSEVRNYGLSRINDAVKPLLDSLQTDLAALVAQGQIDLASQSAAVAAKLAEVDAVMVLVETRIAKMEASVVAIKAATDAHAVRTDNPHGVTADQIGAVPLTALGSAEGAATLTAGKVTEGQLVGSVAVFTGEIRAYAFATPPAGWLSVNGDTLGDASSGATRASDSYKALFLALWNAYCTTYCPVVGGKGTSADADWGAHKKITLLDFRGRTLVGAGTGSGLSTRILGSGFGEESHTLSLNEMPYHTHNSYTNSNGYSGGGPALYCLYDPGGGQGGWWQADSIGYAGGNWAHNNIQPSSVVNWIIKY